MKVHKILKALDVKRYKHTIGVVETADKLAQYWKVNRKKAKIASFFHDLGRQFNNEELIQQAKKYKIRIGKYEIENPLLLHGRIAVEILKKKYNFKEKDVLRSILFHTTGSKRMTKLEKIIYLADYIEPGRKFKGVKKLKKLAFKNLNGAVAEASKITLKYLKNKKMSIHPKTVECYLSHKE